MSHDFRHLARIPVAPPVNPIPAESIPNQANSPYAAQYPNSPRDSRRTEVLAGSCPMSDGWQLAAGGARQAGAWIARASSSEPARRLARWRYPASSSRQTIAIRASSPERCGRSVLRRTDADRDCSTQTCHQACADVAKPDVMWRVQLAVSTSEPATLEPVKN